MTRLLLVSLFLICTFLNSALYPQTKYLSPDSENICNKRGLTDSLKYYYTIISSAEDIKDTLQTGLALYRLGEFLEDNNALLPAEEILQQAETIFAKRNDIKNQIECVNLLGIVQNTLGKNSLALATHNRNLQLARKTGDLSLVSRAYGKKALVYYYTDRLDSALSTFDKAIEISEKEKDNKSLVILYNNRAIVFDEQSDYKNAWNNYNKSLEMARELKDTIKIATCLNNLAIVLETEGKYYEASDYYSRAIEIVERVNSRERIALYKANYAYILELQNLFDKALAIQKECLDINLELNLPYQIAFSYQNIARVYGKMDSPDSAYKSYKLSNDYFEKVGRKSGIAINNVNMGTLLQGQNKFAEAVNVFLEAEKVLAEIKDVKNLAACYTNLGNCYYYMGELDMAEQYAKKALDSAHELGVQKIEADVSGVLANIYKAKNYPARALFYREQNQALNDSLMNEAKIREIAQVESKYRYEKIITQKETEKDKLALQLSAEILRKRFFIIVSALVFFILCVVIYFYITIRRKNRTLFNKNIELLNSSKLCEAKPDEITIDREKYSSSKLSEDEIKRIKSRLLELMKKEKAWKNPGLTINDLASEIETNSTYLSQIINSEFDKNFTSFINEFRIRESERLITKGFHLTRTFEALAKECGFNSRATFISAFKKITGLTPSRFSSLVEEPVNN